jgi:hypothetical protein
MCLSLIFSALTALVGQEGPVHDVLGGQAGVGSTADLRRERQGAEGGRGFPFRDVLQLGILSMCCVCNWCFAGPRRRDTSFGAGQRQCCIRRWRQGLSPEGC